MADSPTCIDRYQLLPYTIEQAKTGGAVGLPLLRHMILEHPTDHNVGRIETQYYFGSQLLVAPILQPAEDAITRSVYLPAGTWYDFWTKERIVARGDWIELRGASIGLDQMPIFVKDGAVICWAEDRLRTFNSVGKIVKVQVWGEGKGGWSCGDGEEGVVRVVKEEDGKWRCEDRENLEVEVIS